MNLLLTEHGWVDIEQATIEQLREAYANLLKKLESAYEHANEVEAKFYEQEMTIRSLSYKPIAGNAIGLIL